jgi:CSLREA domain-containing protein
MCTRLLVLALAVSGFVLLLAERPDAHASPTTFTVNSTADPGDGVCDATECTLREAIHAANFNPGKDTIAFSIPGDGPHTIRPTLPLWDIIDSVIIDGYTQSGASPNTNGPGLGTNAVLKVELDGSNAGDYGFGLRIIRGSSTIRGLVINRYSFGAGIFIDDEGGNIIEGNFIGTDVSGTAALGNGVGLVMETSFNTIGGTTPEARNVISGNQGDAIYMYFGGENIVQGNFIGLDATGTAGLPNSGFGVNVYTSSGNCIGGTIPEARNIISMSAAGVHFGNGANGNLVQGNYLGTDVTGMATPIADPWTGAQFGVLLEDASNNTIGGTIAGARNVISGRNGNGIGILRPGATGNKIEGNFIGTDATGSGPLGNLSEGVDLFVEASGNTIGGAASGSGNLIAYNGSHGVRVYGTGTEANPVRGNSIHSNSGKGIDNDSGGNTELTPPVITGFGSVVGTACPNCTVDVYSDDEDEGRVYEGSTTADGAGNWALGGSPHGPNVTATATDAAGNTSEFSAPVPASPPAVGGTIELRSDGLGTARPPDESGSSVPYAPLAAALATGTISVAVACWYARRRWLRR